MEQDWTEKDKVLGAVVVHIVVRAWSAEVVAGKYFEAAIGRRFRLSDAAEHLNFAAQVEVDPYSYACCCQQLGHLC